MGGVLEWSSIYMKDGSVRHGTIRFRKTSNVYARIPPSYYLNKMQQLAYVLNIGV